MKIIERKDYINRLIRLRNTPDIKIITGLRRSGKSELVRVYMDWISTNEDANIIYNISNLTSASKVSNVFKQNKVETNHITVGKI